MVAYNKTNFFYTNSLLYIKHQFFLSQQRHVIRFEKELRLETTTAWDSKLDSFLLSHIAAKLNYLINYS